MPHLWPLYPSAGAVQVEAGRIYLALPDTANVWDVTEVERAGDTADTGRFQKNIFVNTVIIVSEGQVRTAWVWDLDDDQTIGNGFSFSWELTNYERVYPFGNGWGQYQILNALMDERNVMVLGDLTLTSDLYIPEGLIVQVEGDLNENSFRVYGGGTLRVRENYMVNNGASIGDSTVTVTTQVGGDVILTEGTTVNGRMGVEGDIYSATVNNKRNHNLTVNGSVYVTGDVYADLLTVNGHIEADDYHLTGGRVNSNRTLVALGDVYLYGGTLFIGDDTVGSVTKGAAEINGQIKNIGNLAVENGTLTMTRSASINLTGNVTVEKGGVIEQPNGVAHNLVATGGTVTINGTVTIPGTIEADSVVLGATADVTLNKMPSCPITVDPDAELTIVGGGSSTTDGLALESFTVKGVDVRFKNNTATVELGTEQVNDKATFAYTTSLAGTTVTFVKGGSVVNNPAIETLTAGQSATYTITLTKDGYTPVVYTITVTCKDLVKVTVTDDGANVSIKTNDKVVKGEAITFTVSDTATKTVSKVVYTIDGGKQNEELGDKAGTYTIPADKVTGDVTITVTATDAPMAANVTLKLATDKEDEALWSGDPVNGYTVTVSGDLPADKQEAGAYLAFASGEDTTTRKNLKAGTLNGSVYTISFPDKVGTGEQVITVTFKVADDPKTCLELDMKSAVAAVEGINLDYTKENVTKSEIERVFGVRVSNALKDLTWGSTAGTPEVKLITNWETPPAEGGTKEAQITVNFTLTKDGESLKADEMTLNIEVTRQATT